MQLSVPIDIRNMKSNDPMFVAFTAQLLRQIIFVLNGNVDFQDNCGGEILSLTFLKANTSQAFGHGIGKIPRGYFQIGANAAASLYNGTSSNTTGVIYLQCTVATTVKILLF
jgi:hypothetical protein